MVDKDFLCDYIFTHSIDAIYIISDKGFIIDANRTATEMLGYSHGELVSMHVSEIDPSFTLERISSLADGSSFLLETTQKRKDGLTIEAEINITNTDNNCYVAFVRDITKRKKTERELLQKEERLSLALEGAKEGLWDWDVKNGFEYHSGIYKSMLGYSDSDMEDTHKAWMDIVHRSDRKKFINGIERVFKAGNRIYREELRLRSKNGRYRWVRIRGFVQYDGTGKPSRVVGFTTDISEEVEKTEKLKALNVELLAAKEKAEEGKALIAAFLANLSHEIRTPMNGILGFADLLQNNDEPEDTQQLYVELIRQSGERMLNIINNIVDISRIESGHIEIELENVNINRLFGELFHFFKPEAEKKDIFISYSITSEMANEEESENFTIYTDYGKLNQILINLLKNAIKFTNEGLIEFGCIRKKDKYEFFIRDTGIGIPADKYSIIFERFRQAHNTGYTRNYEGTGLGLSICKSFIDILGGEIFAESVENEGSIFWFILPAFISSGDQRSRK